MRLRYSLIIVYCYVNHHWYMSVSYIVRLWLGYCTLAASRRLRKRKTLHCLSLCSPNCVPLYSGPNSLFLIYKITVERIFFCGANITSWIIPGENILLVITFLTAMFPSPWKKSSIFGDITGVWRNMEGILWWGLMISKSQPGRAFFAATGGSGSILSYGKLGPA